MNITYRILFWVCKSRGWEKNDTVAPYILNRHLLELVSEASDGKIIYSGEETFPPGGKRLEWIYLILTVLDTKASALMRLNGVMLAAAALLLNPTYKGGMSVAIPVAVSAIGSVTSIILCLLVVAVDWPFLGLVKKVNKGGGMVEADFCEEFKHLTFVAHLRQVLYRLAWSISFVGGLCFLVAMFLFFCLIL
jgi:hypothetical protein